MAHLARYSRLIGLDPFPHNGVTITCAALWMGVPVIALRGERHSARMCASVLSNALLSECVAGTAQEYVRHAISLASNLPRLATLRAGLRERLRASPLLDETGITRDVEAAYRSAWRNWCRGSRPHDAQARPRS